MPVNGGQGLCLIDMTQKVRSRDFFCPHERQMGGILLAVYPANPMPFAKGNQGRQGNFGAIGYQAEHGFAKHGLTEADAVQTATKLTIHPCFDTVGQACSMQCFIGLDHVVNDPSPLLAGSGHLRTLLNDAVKSSIDANFKWLVLHPLPQ